MSAQKQQRQPQVSHPCVDRVEPAHGLLWTEEKAGVGGTGQREGGGRVFQKAGKPGEGMEPGGLPVPGLGDV